MTHILLFLLSLSGVMIIGLILGVFWAIKTGQFEDMDGPAQRILMDEDDPMIPANALKKERD